MENIWFRDPGGAFRDDRLSRFIPMPNTPLTNQLNALFRLSIYYAIAVVILRQSVMALYIPLVTAAITYFVYVHDRERHTATKQAMERMDVAVERDAVPCTRPTEQNPFMNVLMSDFSRFPDRPQACDISREGVGNRVTAMFNLNAKQASDDIYERNTGLRQFHTTAASTIPNDQDGFAKWLYRADHDTCKEGNGEVCAQHTFKYVPDT